MNKKYFLISAVSFLVLLGVGCNKEIGQPATVSTGQPIIVDPSSSNLVAIEPVNEEPISEQDLKEAVLYSGRKALMARNDKEGIFSLQINPALPLYEFRVFASTGARQGSIEVSKSSDSGKPQVINLDPNLFRAQDAPLSFDVNDINFDDFLDIGIIVDGGAKWAAYQYWTFDPKTGQFIISPIAEEFRKIGFNLIKFDVEHKRIITNNFEGALLALKQVYVVEGGHLKLVEEYHQEQGYQNDKVIKQCIVATKKYIGNKVQSTTEILNDMCAGYGVL